jgi:Domain of unknown function (DUF6894)
VQFFFHVVGGGIDYEDDSGEDFPSVETAIVRAFRIAVELRADDPNFQWHAVKVIGEAGNEVARVPIKAGSA